MANIQNELNNIKNAVFGKDVRDSIHDAIKTCYDDASVNDNANMEVKLARGVYKTLNERLNESDKKQEEISSQLDHKANKSETLISLSNKRDKNVKINQSDLDVSSEKNKIQLYNLSDSVLEHMTGVTPISPIIDKKSITPEKTTFFKLSNNNLYNPQLETTGNSISNLNGTLNVNDKYKASDYIPVQGGFEYYVSNNYDVAYYNSEKVFVSGVQGGTWHSPLVIPISEGIAYARFTFDVNGSAYVYENENPNKYIAYGDYNIDICDPKVNGAIEKTIKSELDKYTPPKNSLDIDTLKCLEYKRNNLYDLEDAGDDNTSISHTNGTIITYNGYRASGFIEVEENVEYYCTRNFNIAFYDVNMIFVSGLQGGKWNNIFTVPSGAKYVRVTFLLDDPEAMLVKGNTKPSKYFPYGQVDLAFTSEKYRKELLEALKVQDNKLIGLRWNVLGDSLTSIDYSRPNWNEILQSKYDMTVNNYGISGTTLAHTHDRHLWDYKGGRLNADTIGYVQDDPSTWSTGNCFVERYLKMEDDVDLITVMGGTNDNNVTLGEWGSNDTTTFYGALNVLIQGLISKYPDKVIAFFTPIQTRNCYKTNVANPSTALDSKPSTSTLTLQLRAEAIKRKCNQYGIPCLDLFNMSGINGVSGRADYFYRPNDNYHTSIEGNERMSVVIENFLRSIV